MIRQSLILMLSAATAASAQSVRPAWNLDLVAGSGPTTHFDGVAWYRDNAPTFGRVALTVAFPTHSRIRPVVTLDRSENVVLSGSDAICEVAPDGSCRREFPPIAGYALGAGLRVALVPMLDVGVAAGVGSMGGRSEYANADLALRLTAHMRAVAELRQLTVHEASGGRLWWRPISFGLRLQ